MKFSTYYKNLTEAKEQIFKLISKDFGHQFSFHAKNEKEAKTKLMGWLRYNGYMRDASEYTLEPTMDTNNIHDEYV